MLFCLAFSTGWGQVYSENYTGQNGKGQIGTTLDLSGVNWTIDVTGGTFSGSSEFFAVQSGQFEAQDVDGTVFWKSPFFSIDSLSTLQFSIDLLADGDFEAGSDIFEISIVLEPGTSNESIQTIYAGTVNESLSNDPFFVDGRQLNNSLQAFKKNINVNGTNALIEIRVNNNAGSEKMGWDNISLTATSNDLTTKIFTGLQPTATTVTATQVDNKTSGFAVLEYVVEDQDSGDGKATDVTQIEFEAGSGNTINWQDQIEGFQLDTSNTTKNVIDFPDFASTSINAGTITATLSPGTWVIPDGQDDTAQVYIWLKQIIGITDGGKIQMEIPTNHGFMAPTSGSGFANPITSAITGNVFTVNVVASAMRFTISPSNTSLGTAMAPPPKIELVNDNQALDTDANPSVSLTSSASNFDAAATTSVAATNGVVTFNNLLFSTTATGVTLNATTNNLTPITSRTFDVVGAAPALLISQYVETSSGSNPKGIEIWNLSGSIIDFSTEKLEVNVYTNGSSSASKQAEVTSGTLNHGEVVVIGGSDLDTFFVNNPISNGFFEKDAVSYNGNDAVEITLGGTTTDVIGQIGSDPGSAWTGNGVSTENQNISLKPLFNSGDANGTDVYDPTVRYQTLVSNASNSSTDLVGFGEAPYSVYDGNWSNGNIASGATDDDFYVASGTVTITANQVIEKLAVAPGATVEVNFNSLTTGEITNNGTVLIADNASLLQTTSTVDNGSGTYQVENKAIYANPAAFKYWSSPVSGETMGDVFGNTNNNDWYNWIPGSASDSTTNWDPITSGYTFEAGRGVITTPQNTGTTNISETRTFEGTLHNGPYTYAAGSLNVGDFILVGNPYPSAIRNSAFVADNTDLNGTLYYWNHTTFGGSPAPGDYASWNSTGSVNSGNSTKAPDAFTAAMQGFFVSVATAGNIDVTFNNGQRVTGNNSQFFKQESSDTGQRIWLRAQRAGGVPDRLLVGLLEQATDGQDRLFDGAKLKGNPNIAFYSILGQKDLAIQALDQDLKDDKVIPLGLDAGQTGRYTIALDSLDNWPGHTLALLDSAQGTVTNLKQNDYRFAVNQTGAIRGRFFLLVSSKPFAGVGLRENTSGELLYFQRGESLIVDSRLQNSPLEAVTLRSVSGRMIRQATPGTLRHELSVGNLPRGVYLLETQNHAGESSHHKVYLR